VNHRINYSSKRLISAGAAALLGAASLVGGLALAQTQTQTAAKPQMSEVAFKNIQVLKGIPVDEFMGTMGLFSAALSVCCGDCHVNAGTDRPQWDADPPRKIVARKMIQMVNAINRDNFKGTQVVTCWTCHRGAQNPATTPPIDAIYSTPVFVPPDVLPAANPATAGTPPADQILDKYAQTLGTADARAKLTSYTAKGTSMLFGEAKSDPAEIYAKAPNMLATYVHQREGDMARTFDGRDAWVMLPLTVVQEYQMFGSAREGGRLDAQMAFPGGLRQFFKNWKVTYPATIDEKDVYVLQATGDNGLLATFYFDQKTGLLNRMVRYVNSAVGRVPTQIDYADYRKVAGVMMPYKWTYGWVSGREEYNITEYQANAAVDNSKFAKPVQRAK